MRNQKSFLMGIALGLFMGFVLTVGVWIINRPPVRFHTVTCGIDTTTSMTSGQNLELAGTFTCTPGGSILLINVKNMWYEISRTTYKEGSKEN